MTTKTARRHSTAPDVRENVAPVRALDAETHSMTIRVVSYNVVDSYGSVWAPGCFNASLDSRLPSSVWAHDRSKVIGSVTSYSDGPDGLDAVVQFANLDEVPIAREAYSLIRDGHVSDTSFGFSRVDWQEAYEMDPETLLPGQWELIRVARLDEVSPVVVGAVPGAGVQSIRSAPLTRSDVVDLVTRLHAGQITLDDALRAVDGVPVEPVVEVEPEPTPYVMADDVRATAVFLLRVEGTDRALDEEFTHGARAAGIRWGTDGDLDRAVDALGRYMSEDDARAYAADLRAAVVAVETR